MPGSSPQARGARHDARVDHHVRRLIPAGAGSTRTRRWWTPGRRAHPRRRGEHPPMSPLSAAPVGSSPQARGAQPQMGDLYARLGLIPAGAGSTVGLRAPARRWSAHPRRRGEHMLVRMLRIFSAGSSPQARGAHARLQIGDIITGLIPAGAGSTSRLLAGCFWVGAHPRRRGEHHQGHRHRPGHRGLIPAGAGSTPRIVGRPVTTGAHPRRRGEHFAPLSSLVP